MEGNVCCPELLPAEILVTALQWVDTHIVVVVGATAYECKVVEIRD